MPDYEWRKADTVWALRKDGEIFVVFPEDTEPESQTPEEQPDGSLFVRMVQKGRAVTYRVEPDGSYRSV